MIKKAGVVDSDVEQELCYIKEDVEICDNNGRSLKLSPSCEFSVDVALNVGPLRQSASLKISPRNYVTKISKARTFGFFKDREKFQTLGLIKGVSFDNSLILDDDGTPLNRDGFRFKNEPAYHKILDLIGDFGLIGMPIVCKVSGSPSHTLNNLIIKKCLTFSSKYAIMKKVDTSVRVKVPNSAVETRVQYI